MHQKNFKLLILGLVLVANTNSFGSVSATFQDREWEFLEYKLISKVKKAMNKPLIGGVSSWAIGGLTALNTIQRMHDSSLRRYVELGSFSFFLAYPFIGIYLLNRYEKNVQFNILKKFIAKWPKYKQYTPKFFHESLDKLYEKHGNYIECLSRKKALKLMKIMQGAVMNRNPVKYYRAQGLGGPL